MENSVLDRVLNGILPDSDKQKISRIERYLTCFACFRCLAQTVDDKKWRYPHAAYAREHVTYKAMFGVDFAYQKELDAAFDRVYDFFAELSVFDFLDQYISSWPEAKRAAEQIKVYVNNEVGDIGLCMSLVLAWREQAGLQNTQPYASDYKRRMSKEAWKNVTLLGTPGTIPLEYKSEVYASSRRALKTLKDVGFGMQEQLRIYQMIREEIVGSYDYKRKKDWQRRADYPWRYLRKLHGKNPQIDLLGWNDELDSATEAIAKVKRPTDYLSAMYDLCHLDDSDLEHDFVLPAFDRQLSEKDMILIVNPAPTFLKYYASNKWVSSAVFCVPFVEMAEVLREEFPTMSFSTYDSPALADGFGANTKFTKILAFFRGTDEETRTSLMESLSRIASRECRLYALLPADCVVNSTEKNAPYLFDRFHIEAVDVVKSAHPSRSEPVHKAFVSARFDGSSANVSIRKYELLRGAEKMPSILREQGKVSCSAEVLHGKTGISSLNKLYTYLRNRPSEEKRSKPDCYKFSPEICFWYKKSMMQDKKMKVEAYVCDYATAAQTSRTVMARGKRIGESYFSVTVPQGLNLDEWLVRKLPYSGRIHDGAVKAYERAEKNGLQKYPLLRDGICLKTLWYLYLEIPADKKNYQPSKEEWDLFSSCVGGVRVADLEGENGAAIIERAMGAFQAESGAEDMLPYWVRLGHLLAVARRDGHISHNPVAAILENEEERRIKKELANLKGALAKRSFHEEEERRLFQTLSLGEGDRPEHLAVAIRFFTGVEANIVSALTWGDIHHIPGLEFDQFHIYRQTDNAALKIRPFDNLSSYRRIPISPMLKQALEARKRYLLESLHVNDLDGLQIVATEQYVLDAKHPQITPRTINKWTQKAVQRIGVEDNCIITADENGVIETNLADYHGDIFRSNFKYRANYTCGFTDAEVRYILGLRQSTVFGKNYCDFANDFAQFAMYRKLCRWEAMLAAEPPDKLTKCEHNQVELCAANVGGAKIQIALRANEKVELSIRCPSGVSGDILLCGEGG